MRVVRSRLNILFITQNYPYPEVLHGGGQDYWHLIDALRKRHNIYVATFDDPVTPTPDDALRPYVQDLKVIRYARTKLAKIFALSKASLRGYRNVHLRRREWEMLRVIEQWSRLYAIDILHCGWTEMGRYLHLVPQASLRILDEVDVRFLSDEQRVINGQMPVELAEQRKTEELNYCRAADLVLTRSRADLHALRQEIPTLRGQVLPPAGNVAHLLDIQPEEAYPARIMFCGAMNRQPNIEAVLWLVSNVWPLVKQVIPDCEFYIVGAFPPPDVVALGKRPNITVTGKVTNLRSYYAASRVIVAPLHVPAGSLNKVIDGLAAGRPVVATSFANRGLNAPCVQIADTPELFAETIIKFIVDQALWYVTGCASRAYILAHHNWQTAVDELERFYIHYAEATISKQHSGQARLMPKSSHD